MLRIVRDKVAAGSVRSLDPKPRAQIGEAGSALKRVSETEVEPSNFAGQATDWSPNEVRPIGAPAAREISIVAEEEGFEPPGRVNAQRFSRPPLSTAQPFLQPK